jgi:predicted glutamine amidotransferase
VHPAMCRLLGIVSSEPTAFRIVLKEAPRSMAVLSEEHRDGWGLAVHDDGRNSWTVHKGVERAGEDERFHQHAVGARGELLIAHVRRRTVGVTSMSNTHPFHRGPWVFAHNGTIADTDYLRAHTSRARLAEVRGETDSELFFAHLLSRFDEAGVTDVPAGADTDAVVGRVAREVRERPGIGAVNFLLSNGRVLYAHRFGRTLHLLERGPHDPVVDARSSRDGTVVRTPWSTRRHAVLVASEEMTTEPWQEVGEGMLLRVDRAPHPRWRPIF